MMCSYEVNGIIITLKLSSSIESFVSQTHITQHSRKRS